MVDGQEKSLAGDANTHEAKPDGLGVSIHETSGSDKDFSNISELFVEAGREPRNLDERIAAFVRDEEVLAYLSTDDLAKLKTYRDFAPALGFIASRTWREYPEAFRIMRTLWLTLKRSGPYRESQLTSTLETYYLAATDRLRAAGLLDEYERRKRDLIYEWAIVYDRQEAEAEIAARQPQEAARV